jgi:hypothetical protein
LAVSAGSRRYQGRAAGSLGQPAVARPPP